MTSGSDLHEWTDMLNDAVRIRDVTRDEWGNESGTWRTVYGQIISRNLGGGSNTGEETATLPNNWTVTVVVPFMTPSPTVGATIEVNGVEYEIDSMVLHEDIDGFVFEVTATITEPGDPT